MEPAAERVHSLGAAGLVLLRWPLSRLAALSQYLHSFLVDMSLRRIAYITTVLFDFGSLAVVSLIV